MYKSFVLLSGIFFLGTAVFAWESGDAHGALIESEAMLKRNPQSQKWQLVHVDALGHLKRYDEELTEAKQLVAKYPKLRRGYLLEQHAYAELKQYGPALSAMDKAFALEPPTAQELNIKATILAKFGRLEDAISWYGKVLALDPDYAEAYACRGACDFKLYGPSERSIKDLEKSILLNPSNEIAKRMLAEIKQKMP